MIMNTIYDACTSLQANNIKTQQTKINCWFVWSFSSHSGFFLLIWRRQHCRWRAANFTLWSTIMAIEEWGFLSVPQLLQHGTSVDNGHFRGTVILTPYAERLAVDLSIPTKHETFLKRFEKVSKRFLVKKRCINVFKMFSQ